MIDPLGRPLDRDEPIAAEVFHPIERSAPAIIDRALVSEPVETGVLVVDALFALGRGQRELIIGDRATGKTSIAVDTIISQKRSDMICVYVAVGQRATAVERVVEAVRQFGAPERCVFVIASAAASAALQWIAPFAGFTIGEYFRDRGGHALVIVDDLTKHAVTHRELALLTREPPGREAYPGDIFYVHARLLERAAKLAPELGGGSLTALPIAETDAGNLSAFIPTNLISITDGQIVLNLRLFAANQRPAVDVGLSVSRVGGKAQAQALRAASGRLRLDYSQFLELEMFTRFGGIADTRVRGTIARGERIRALIAQPRFATLRLVDQVALLSALADGVFDDVAAAKVAEARQRIAAELDARSPETVAGDEDRDLRRGGPRAAGRGGAGADQGRFSVTERLSEVTARIGSVRQLSSVIGAMRGIAAARAREARERVEGVCAYARTVGGAIGQALALIEPAPGAAPDGEGGHLVIALCAEQGFAGPFNRRVLDAAERLMNSRGPRGSELLLLGGRGLIAAEERGLKVGWSASMIAHVDEAAALADRVTEQLYAQLEHGRATQVSLAHATPEPSAEITLSSARSRHSISPVFPGRETRRRRSFRCRRRSCSRNSRKNTCSRNSAKR